MLYYGDMDGSGEMRLIEAISDADALLPIRGRSCSAKAMAFLTGKFPSYHHFSSAVLSNIPNARVNSVIFTLSGGVNLIGPYGR